MSALGCGGFLAAGFGILGRKHLEVGLSKGSCWHRWVCLVWHCAFLMCGFFSRGGLVIESLHIAAVFMTVVGRFPVQWLLCSVCVILLCRRRSRVICLESYVLYFFLIRRRRFRECDLLQFRSNLQFMALLFLKKKFSEFKENSSVIALSFFLT